MDILSLFDIFNKTNRKIIPLSLYLGYEQDDEDTEKNDKDMTFANSNDFPEELFDKIIIMTKRLHEMGVYEEKEIVRFIIPKILKALEAGEILSGVSISSFDTTGVVFGENYAGWLYKSETKKGNEILYKVPYQLIFYHSKKEDNYFICKTKNGLELRQNKVSITNSDDKEHIIKNTKSINLTKMGMKELKDSFSILFMYIKMNILLKMKKLGYLDFIEKIAEFFCSSMEKDEFISYAKQYFALSIDKEKNPLAYVLLPFKDFLSELLIRNNCSTSFFTSYADIIKWIKERTKIKIDIQKEYHDHIEFIKDVSNILISKEYYLYFLIKEDFFHKTSLLIGKQKGIFENNSNFSYEITSLSDDLIEHYIEDISRERKIRELVKRFFQIINIVDIQSMMMNIRGNRVLDYALVKNYYLSVVYSDEDMNIYNVLGKLLSKYAMPDLIKNTTAFDATLDNLYFLEFESVNPVDRAILYADLIRQNKKLLYSFEVGDYFYLGIIEDNIEIKDNFIKYVNNLLEMKEIENYVIYDSKNKEMFVNLLSGIDLLVESEFSYTQKDIREKFYKENSENISIEDADKYLSRIVLEKSEIKICVSNYYEDEEELEFTIKAENRKYFTNQDLIFQIQRYLAEKIDFTKIFSSKICISGLRLSIDRDKYYLFWNCV
ncbi:hypothetical protein HMPREF0397_1993 [Fusobacterium nucleatum subsp. nucleatum ATCC 23726]|uniref:Uncharacterized protein n=1 Tax=Fusobacterium nucleatum subsp. nucleatum (strain ATCC 23726 / VPI 4351) TaxID=525283 RepID=D5RFK8_FUSN2|nr:hypothetical protein [Fusobacterium nucleatum]AVQ22412.1 hypothetical protein C4N14_01160 [Fusobacterium nucleatum subsp. nucleatum ATCC 23726]EFG94472.1 hypothetical protein HMPREF0397_1993 [Fusobacterium nucleatum subsp. nucleatum ATCC 23726]